MGICQDGEHASTLVFLLVRRVLRLVGLGSAPDDKDIEIA
jgi:hypothetical protein